MGLLGRNIIRKNCALATEFIPISKATDRLGRSWIKPEKETIVTSLRSLALMAAAVVVLAGSALIGAGSAEAGYTACNPWGCYYQPTCTAGYWAYGPYGAYWVAGYCF
mgnify:CR=1 FL=1